MNDSELEQSADDLRVAFEAAFAEPMVLDTTPQKGLLLVRVQGEEVALFTNQLAGILRCPVLIPAPSSNAAFVGLAGIRGSVVVVFSLAVLRGQSHDPYPRGWIARCRASRDAALWFDELLGYEEVRSESRIEMSVVNVRGRSVPVVDVLAALQTIRRRGSARREGVSE